MRRSDLVFVAATLILAGTGAARAQQAGAGAEAMTFFVSSENGGKGGDLGGLTGADALCQRLATAAGSKGLLWHAYLSTSAFGGGTALNARDRIGKGPWHNAKGQLIAKDVDSLHSAAVNASFTKQTALTEKGTVVNGRGDTPNQHDVLTGTKADGTAFPADKDTTCGNWTSSDAGAAQVGHADRTGLTDDDVARSWNSAHLSGGCSQPALVKTGGNGYLYCFAVR